MRLLLIPPILLAFLATGCVYTHQDWREALSCGSFKDPVVFRIATPPREPSQKVLLVQYSLENVRHQWGPDYSKIFVSIPLDKDLNPDFPLHFPSSPGGQPGLYENLPFQQLKALKNYKFSQQSIAAGSQLAKLNATSQPSQGKDNESCINITNNIYNYNLEGDSLALSVIIWKEGAGTISLHSSPSMRIYNAIDKHPSPEDHALILPVEINRPFTGRIKALGMAALKTPADITLDFIFVGIKMPIYLLVYVIAPHSLM